MTVISLDCRQSKKSIDAIDGDDGDELNYRPKSSNLYRVSGIGQKRKWSSCVLIREITWNAVHDGMQVQLFQVAVRTVAQLVRDGGATLPERACHAPDLSARTVSRARGTTS